MSSTISLGAAVLTALVYFFRLEIDYLRRLDERRFEEEQKIRGNEIPSYDFIIVGGGTAGCLLAGRLSKHFTVLLLELGGPTPSLTAVPAFRSESAVVPEINYAYKTVPQTYIAGTVMTFTQGKMFGGSFAHNELIQNRGNRRDYDTWASLTKDDSWKYDKVIPIYKKLEAYHGPYKSNLRGSKGPIPIYTGNPPALPTYKEAAKELGYSFGDANGYQKEGFSPVDFTIGEGRAVTTCSAFIDPILGVWKNLRVLTYAKVEMVLFSHDTATGVHYIRHGKSFKAKAIKEVIVSAGPIGSPVLLWKSGIGPKEMLGKAKISTIADLPVGRTLINHPRLPMNFTSNKRTNFVTIYYNLTAQKFEEFLKNGNDGVLSIEGSGPQANFVSSMAKKTGEGDWPDIQLMRGVAAVDSTGLPYYPAFTSLTRPKSVGSLTLNVQKYLSGKHKNTDLAVIDFNLLSNKDDKPRLLEGVKKVLKVYSSKAFANIGTRLLPYKLCENFNVNSDSYWECAIDRSLQVSRHLVATCRMGYGKEDKISVVGPDFRVHGLKRLRVIDSSAMPLIINANVNAPTILLAEKAANQIIKEYRA